jgi:hypothetical protein
MCRFRFRCVRDNLPHTQESSQAVSGKENALVPPVMDAQTEGRQPATDAEAEGRLSPAALDARPLETCQDNLDHLWHELCRIDRLIRAQTVRWQETIAAHKPAQLWGMVHVTDAEVNAYLNAPCLPPDRLPPELYSRLKPYWDAVQREARPPLDESSHIGRLQSLFGLSNLEYDIVLVCLWPELDARYRRLFGYLQDDCSRRKPSVELVLQILQPTIPDLCTGRAAFDAQSPLLANNLIELDTDGAGNEPLSVHSLHLDERIVNFLLGSDALDGRLAGVISQPTQPIKWDQLIAEPEHLARLHNVADWWRQQQQSARPSAVWLLHGPYGSGRLAAARAICTDSRTPLLVAAVAPALRASAGWERMVSLCYREAALRGAALYWSECERLLAPEQPPHLWQSLLSAAERYPGLTFLASETVWDPAGAFHETPFVRLDFPMPNFALRLRLWQEHLPSPQDFAAPVPDRNSLTNALANGFQLTEGRIVDAVMTARAQAAKRDPQQPRLTSDDLYEGCRRQSGRRLISFARRIEPRADLTFADLILPGPNKRQLLELCARIRHHSQLYSGFGFERRLSLGKGLIALFTGSSGTGKTMAAELLAHEQGVDLYKVDLSAVVSKYVGETEKNLSKVFAEAEGANAILFFDEADAIFGKRGEVKEAQDRWANMEVNYLLQRVEEYAGVVILASNLRQNLDESFMRRIHVIVEFPFPEADARFRILAGLFPPAVQRPCDAELRSLSERFKLSGGSYKNIVLDAAFRALAEAGNQQPAITLRQLVAGTAREYQKLGKPITKGEFGEAFYTWVEQDIL